jgi:hypothetical protein
MKVRMSINREKIEAIQVMEAEREEMKAAEKQ